MDQKPKGEKTWTNELVHARVVPFATRLLGNHFWYTTVIVKAASALPALLSRWAVIGLKSRWEWYLATWQLTHAKQTLGALLKRNFKVCGTTVFTFAEAQPGRVGIGVGTFDDTSWVTKPNNIFCNFKQKWQPLPDGAVKKSEGYSSDDYI